MFIVYETEANCKLQTTQNGSQLKKAPKQTNRVGSKPKRIEFASCVFSNPLLRNLEPVAGRYYLISSYHIASYNHCVSCQRIGFLRPLWSFRFVSFRLGCDAMRFDPNGSSISGPANPHVGSSKHQTLSGSAINQSSRSADMRDRWEPMAIIIIEHTNKRLWEFAMLCNCNLRFITNTHTHTHIGLFVSVSHGSNLLNHSNISHRVSKWMCAISDSPESLGSNLAVLGSLLEASNSVSLSSNHVGAN